MNILTASNTNKLLCNDELHERQLVEFTARGEKASFEQLVKLYQSRVRAYAQAYARDASEEADDLAQEIFLQIYLSAKRFKARSKVSTWVFSIARNTVRRKVRRKKPIYFWQLKWNTEESIEQCINIEKHECQNGESHYESQEAKQLINEGLTKLSREHREVLVLYEFSGLSYMQIAELLDIKIGTVKSRVSMGREALGIWVRKQYEK